MSRRKKYLILFILALGVAQAVFLIYVWRENVGPSREPIYGITFSKPYAEELGLKWKEVYLAILDDLGVKAIRLSAYWNEIEPRREEYNFDDLDWQIEEAKKRNAKIILAIGRRLPRWPECRVPDWAKTFDEPVQQKMILDMLRHVVNYYKGEESIVLWQIENEPLLSIFGECPRPSREFLKKEVELVKSLDARPALITESGELSTWLRTAGLADVLGISIYRTVWNKFFGYLYYPLTPSYYKRRADLVWPLVQKVIITELQAEPWGPEPIQDISISEQKKSMNPEKFRDAVRFAKRTGFEEIYLWGAEWWYWLKEQDEGSMWEEARRLFKN